MQETFAPPDLNDFSDAGSDEDDEDRSTRERRSSSSRQRSGNGGSTATEEDFSFDNGTSTITVETKEGSVRTFIVDKELVLEVPEGISVSGTITGPSQTTIDQLNRQTNEYYDNILKQTPDSASKYRQQLGQNRVGDRISAVGFQGYSDIFENSRDVVDIVYLRKLKKGEIKLAISDILAQPSKYYQKNRGDLIKTNNEQTISLTINLNL